MIGESGGWGVEFHTIAGDDGIAMGHAGMLYSLPSRELIADSVEYMVSAHCADALLCISNCDKITPGMLLAAMRLNVPTVFVSGGPMEAGKVVGTRDRDGKPLIRTLDLIDPMFAASDASFSAESLFRMDRPASPPRANPQWDGKAAHECCHGRNHDRTKPNEAYLINRLGRSQVLLTLRFHCEVDHHDRVLLDDADQHDHSHERVSVEVEPENQQRLFR